MRKVQVIKTAAKAEAGGMEMAGNFSRHDGPRAHDDLPNLDMPEVGGIDLLARLRTQNFALERLRNALDFEDDVASPPEREPLPV
ncbi:hypothetical protein [Aurantimonas sp. HBX-1]|uniref:hypothetical protein n=1 Tax=Aurantimonas sp. HBX-1 TaxID=2906072 RepID=UPI001F439C0A|nr:hypothetical protein [Aurantimonas sp. HBX-1]UIJ73928.1 hypothetical protein LXB15_10100 [Aurantimonas sp. HBX-1]